MSEFPKQSGDFTSRRGQVADELKPGYQFANLRTLFEEFNHRYLHRHGYLFGTEGREAYEQLADSIRQCAALDPERTETIYKAFVPERSRELFDRFLASDGADVCRSDARRELQEREAQRALSRRNHAKHDIGMGL